MSNTDYNSRAVAMSALLTGVCRRKLGTAPLHGFSGPPGSGKTEFADFVALTASGRPSTRLHIGDEAALFRALQDRAPVILFDGVREPIDWPTLAHVLRHPTWKGLPTDALFLACGQDLTFSPEMAELVVVGYMRGGPPRELMAEPEVARRAAQTILKAFAAAGMPGMKGLPPFGGFKDWSNQVRAPLLWLGTADPVMTHLGTISEALEEAIRDGLVPPSTTEAGLEAALVAAGAKPVFRDGALAGYDISTIAAKFR